MTEIRGEVSVYAPSTSQKDLDRVEFADSTDLGEVTGVTCSLVVGLSLLDLTLLGVGEAFGIHFFLVGASVDAVLGLTALVGPLLYRTFCEHRKKALECITVETGKVTTIDASSGYVRTSVDWEYHSGIWPKTSEGTKKHADRVYTDIVAAGAELQRVLQSSNPAGLHPLRILLYEAARIMKECNSLYASFEEAWYSEAFDEGKEQATSYVGTAKAHAVQTLINRIVSGSKIALPAPENSEEEYGPVATELRARYINGQGALEQILDTLREQKAALDSMAAEITRQKDVLVEECNRLKLEEKVASLPTPGLSLLAKAMIEESQADSAQTQEITKALQELSQL